MGRIKSIFTAEDAHWMVVTKRRNRAGAERRTTAKRFKMPDAQLAEIWPTTAFKVARGFQQANDWRWSMEVECWSGSSSFRDAGLARGVQDDGQLSCSNGEL